MYAKTFDMQPASIAQCYGYIEFAQPPRIQHIHETDEFGDNHLPLIKSIYGIVLEKVNFRKFEASDRASGSELEKSGYDILEKLHAKGIVHGDATGTVLVMR